MDDPAHEAPVATWCSSAATLTGCRWPLPATWVQSEPVSWAPTSWSSWMDVESPPVRHLDVILSNAAIFNLRWGEWPMTTWLQGFADLGLLEYVDGHWQRVGSA